MDDNKDAFNDSLFPMVAEDAKAVASNAYAHQPNIIIRNMVLEMLLNIMCDHTDTSVVQKFANTITCKWILLFMQSDSLYTVVLALRILARLLYFQNPTYAQKFRVTCEGFIVLKQVLPQYWHLTQVYTTLLAILLGVDMSDVPINLKFDVANLQSKFRTDANSRARLACPEIFPVLLAVFKASVSALMRSCAASSHETLQTSDQTRTPVTPSHETEEDKGQEEKGLGHLQGLQEKLQEKQPIRRRRTSSVAARRQGELGSGPSSPNIAGYATPGIKDRISKAAAMQQTMSQLMLDLFTHNPDFKAMCSRAEILDDYMAILLPIVCHTEEISAEKELNSKDMAYYDSEQTPEPHESGHETPLHDFPSPLGASSTSLAQLDSTTADQSANDLADYFANSNLSLRRRSSTPNVSNDFVMISVASPDRRNVQRLLLGRDYLSSSSLSRSSSVRRQMKKKPLSDIQLESLRNSTVDSLFDFICMICIDSIFNPASKNLANLDSILKGFPPSHPEAQISFETTLMNNVVKLFITNLRNRPSSITDERVLANLAKFCTMLVDELYEGRLVDMIQPIHGLFTESLDTIQTMETSGIKRTAKAEQTCHAIYRQFNRLLLHRLLEAERGSESRLDFISALIDEEKLIFSPMNADPGFCAVSATICMPTF